MPRVFPFAVIAAGFALTLAGCGAPEGEVSDTAGLEPGTSETIEPAPADDAPAPPAQQAQADLPPLDPPEPGEPGGLPDDGTPLDESPFTPESAQGAAQVLQLYWIAIENGEFAKAHAMWGQDGEASGMSAEAFAASFDRYSEIHANIGGPGEIEGAAGSLYVEVPVQVYGRMADDPAQQFNLLGPMTLRRVNDVPGSTEAQRAWHIAGSGLEPRP